MRDIFRVAPGALWTAVLVGLTGLATWLTEYLSAEPWAQIVAGALVIIIIPIIKVFAQAGDEPAGPRGVNQRKSAFKRWLF